MRCSPTYETDPVNMAGARRFLNLVISAETKLDPVACLKQLLDIERLVGRPAHTRNLPRVLDLDLLLYDNQVLRRPGLVIPHPRMHERAFVLVPLCDIAPQLIHPVLHQRMTTLLAKTDTRGVRRWMCS